MWGRIVESRERADGLTDASADKAEDATADDYSASDWGPVVSALVRAESRPNAEPDCRSDQNVTGAAVMHQSCLIASPAISMLPWKRRARPSPAGLRQHLAIVSISRNRGGRYILTPRRFDCVLRRGGAFGLPIVCLRKCDRRYQNRCQQEMDVFCMSHERRVALIQCQRWQSGTLSGVSQRFERLADELHIALQFADGRLRDQREGNCPATCGQLPCRQRITHHRSGLFQPSLPVHLAGIP